VSVWTGLRGLESMERCAMIVMLTAIVQTWSKFTHNVDTTSIHYCMTSVHIPTWIARYKYATDQYTCRPILKHASVR